jgi:hypothetical protein
VDRLGRRLAILTSQKLSRRDYLSRLGLYTAGLVGATFAHAVVAPSTFADTAPCTFDSDCGLTANNCGMGSTHYCSKYLGKNKGGTNTTCPDCTLTNGCPQGLTKGTTSWSACCACKEDNTKGHTFKYWDCCGTPAAVCSCTDASVKDCRTSLETTETRKNWCGTTGGSPTCTNIQDTSNTCTTKPNDIQVKWDAGAAS